jgi:hypothetical protein
MTQGGQFRMSLYIRGNIPARAGEPIGNIPPAEAEARYHAQSDELAMVA